MTLATCVDNHRSERGELARELKIRDLNEWYNQVTGVAFSTVKANQASKKDILEGDDWDASSLLHLQNRFYETHRVWWCNNLTPALRRQRQAIFNEAKSSLVYVASSRPARASSETLPQKTKIH